MRNLHMLSGTGGEAASPQLRSQSVLLECTHRVNFPLASWSGPFPLEPWLHWPGSVVLYCCWACRGGEPERLEGERLRPCCSAAFSRSSCREGEELRERWREEEEQRGRGGGLRSSPLRSCISCVRVARKSASLVLLARTLNRRRLEKRAEEENMSSSSHCSQLHVVDTNKLRTLNVSNCCGKT